MEDIEEAIESISELIKKIRESRDYENQIVHIEDIKYKAPEYYAINLNKNIECALHLKGIAELYTHQVEAIESIREGKNVIIVTSTASGKSLAYMIHLLHYIYHP